MASLASHQPPIGNRCSDALGRLHVDFALHRAIRVWNWIHSASQGSGPRSTAVKEQSSLLRADHGQAASFWKTDSKAPCHKHTVSTVSLLNCLPCIVAARRGGTVDADVVSALHAARFYLRAAARLPLVACILCQYLLVNTRVEIFMEDQQWVALALLYSFLEPWQAVSAMCGVIVGKTWPALLFLSRSSPPSPSRTCSSGLSARRFVGAGRNTSRPFHVR